MKVRKKLTEAGNTLDKASQRTRAMKRKLVTVGELPTPAAAQLLGLPNEAVADSATKEAPLGDASEIA